MTIKIITTVGTSIFENYLKNHGKKNNDFKEVYSNDGGGLRTHDFPYSKWDCMDDDVESKRTTIVSIISECNALKNSKNTSAEIRSIIEICKQTQAEYDVHLISTDTVLSVLAAELIRDWFNNLQDVELKPKNLKAVVFDKEKDNHVIKNLRISSKQDFENGFMELVKVLNTLLKKDETILNITGGYKAIIPIVTLLGQLREVPLKYIYNETDLNNENSLIEIGNLPFGFDWAKAERYYLLLTDGKEYYTNNYQKENPEAQDLILECEKLGLIKNKKATHLAQIFISYIKDYVDISKNSLGFFMEYKLVEYFQYNDHETSAMRVLHSIEIEQIAEGVELPKGNEIDILIEKEGVFFNELIEGKTATSKPTENQYITIEVKPLMGINIDQFKLMLERIENHWSKPKEVWLIVYTFLPIEFSKKQFSKKQFSNFSDLFKNREFYCGVKFRIRFLNINLSFTKGEITSKFMKKPLTTDLFLDERIFINGEILQTGIN